MIKASLLRHGIDIALSLLLAVITGLIFYYPDYKIEENINKDERLSHSFVYSPLVFNYPGVVADEVHYAAICRKVMDGIGNINDAHIYEKRGYSGPVGKLPYIVCGGLSRLSGSVISFFKWKNYFFPAVSVIIGYFFLRLFLESRLIAFWGIILILSNYSGTQLVNVLLFRFNSAFSDFYPAISVFTEKYPSYQLIFPFTFLFYLFSYRLLKKNNNMCCLITGIMAGVSFYLYFYSFLGIGGQLAFLTIWTFFQRRRDLSLRFLVSGIIALLIGVFYIKSMVAYTADPNRVFKAMAVGIGRNLDYDIVKAGLKLLLCYALILYLSRKFRSIGDKAVFIFSIGIPVFLLMVLSRFRPILPETQHFHTFEFRTTIFLSILFVMSLLLNRGYIMKLMSERVAHIFNGRQIMMSAIRIGFIALIALHSTQVLASEYYYQSKKSSLYYHRYIIDRDTMDAYNWLDKYAHKDAVVLSVDVEQINMLPIFTGLYVYLPDLLIGMSPLPEVFERTKGGFGFYGINKQVVGELLNYETPFDLMPGIKSGDDIEKIKQVHFEYKKRQFLTLVFGATFDFAEDRVNFQYFKKYLTPEEISAIKKNGNGRRFVPARLLNEELKNYQVDSGNVDLLKYKVNYVWFGPYEKALSGLSELRSDRLKLVYQNTSVKIYQVIKKKEITSERYE